MKKIPAFSILLKYLVFPMFFWSTASVAAMLAMSTNQLTESASSVVMGKVIDSKSMWKGDKIVTVTTLEVTNILKGPVKGKIIEVEYEGGEVGDTGMAVSDVKIPLVGENLLLFLESESNEKFSIVGKAQGQYSIDSKTGVAVKGGYLLLDGSDRENKEVPLEQLINAILDAAKNE